MQDLASCMRWGFKCSGATPPPRPPYSDDSPVVGTQEEHWGPGAGPQRAWGGDKPRVTGTGCRGPDEDVVFSPSGSHRRGPSKGGCYHQLHGDLTRRGVLAGTGRPIRRLTEARWRRLDPHGRKRNSQNLGLLQGGFKRTTDTCTSGTMSREHRGGSRPWECQRDLLQGWQTVQAWRQGLRAQI